MPQGRSLDGFTRTFLDDAYMGYIVIVCMVHVLMQIAIPCCMLSCSLRMLVEYFSKILYNEPSSYVKKSFSHTGFFWSIYLEPSSTISRYQ